MSKRSNKAAATKHEPKVVLRTEAKPNVRPPRTYNIRISHQAYEKVMHWVRECELEVSGYGKVVYHPGSDTFEVVSAYLLEQEVTGASTEIEAQALGKLMYETHTQPGELKWWWH